MSREENIAVQKRWAEAVNTGDLDALDDLAASDCVDHDPAPGQGPGPEGFKGMFKELLTAFPDLQVAPAYLTATDADVAIAYTITGTHEGTFMGHEGTGRKIEVRGVQIGRFAGGKLVERWGSSDQLGILTQLELLPKS